ncbi:MAG: radical SAM protein, partial [bacterium]
MVIEGISGGTEALAGPEHVAIDLTNRCTNRCIACWTRSPLLRDLASGADWHRQELDRGVLDRLIDDLGALGTRNIQLSGGGDPMLYPDIAGVVERVKSHGMYCAITTGLPHPTSRRLGDVVDAGVDELAVSLWASDGRSWVATHPGRGAADFREITRTLAGLKGRGRRPFLNLLNVVCSVNYRKVYSMYRYARSQGADSVYFTLVDVMEGKTESLLLTAVQLR